MSKYNVLRVGSPVKLGERVTSILSLPRNPDDPWGYKVSGSPNAIMNEQLGFIELTDMILRGYGAQLKADGWHYVANAHEVVYADDGMCLVDSEEKDYIKYLHEFKNLLFDECDGFILRQYHGLPSIPAK